MFQHTRDCMWHKCRHGHEWTARGLRDGGMSTILNINHGLRATMIAKEQYGQAKDKKSSNQGL